MKDGSVYSYKTYRINFKELTCTCLRFKDRGLCKHLVAVAVKENLQLDGFDPDICRRLRSRKRRGRKRDAESDLENSINAPLDILYDENVELNETRPKAITAIQERTPEQVGRRKKMSKALVRDDVIKPTRVLRSRNKKN